MPPELRDTMIEALRLVRISFEQPQETIAIEVSEGIVWTLASIAVGTMRALAVKDGWTSEEDIRAYVRRMIDGQLSDLMAGGDGLAQDWTGGPAGS
jgi:hypothetical protein